MSIEIKEELKERVLKFIEEQPGYDADNVEEVKVSSNYMGTWSIVYGESLALGIAGIGDSPEDAFDDFVVKWRFFKGFEWLRKTKMLASM
jgi:hypothetical protein